MPLENCKRDIKGKIYITTHLYHDNDNNMAGIYDFVAFCLLLWFMVDWTEMKLHYVENRIELNDHWCVLVKNKSLYNCDQ